MNKKLLVMAFVIVGGLFFSGCRPVEPVYNTTDVTVQGNNKKLTQAQVEQAIIKACMNREWRVNKVKSGLIQATYNKRGHVAVVDIKYSASKYSITYNQSTNLDYNGTVIHRNYNGWIQNLETDIQNNLLMM